MIDIVVRLEGPIALGLGPARRDRRAGPADRRPIRRCGSPISASAVDFVARVGAADRQRETARLQADRRRRPISPATRSRETGRLIALVDASGERSFLTDRGANRRASQRDIPDALVDGAATIHLSGYTFFAPGPRAAVSSVMRARRRTPGRRRPRLGGIPARGRAATNFLAWTRGATMLFPNGEEAAVLAGTDDPEAQGARLAAHYPLVVVKRGAAGCEAYDGERRWRVAAPAAKLARQHRRRRRLRRRLSRRPARRRADRDAACDAPPPPARRRPNSSAAGRRLTGRATRPCNFARDRSGIGGPAIPRWGASQPSEAPACPSAPSNASANPVPRSKAPASGCGAPSASATRPISIRS